MGERAWLGPGLMAAGVLLVVVALVGLFSSSGASTGVATASTIAPPTSSSPAPTSTTEPVLATTATSTTAATTTTAPATTTTTTTTPAETPEDFAAAFAAALASGDVEFVWSRLHPAVREGWGEELCRAWVEREIMQLSAYTLVSVTGGPVAIRFDTPAGRVTVSDVYDAVVRFQFQGEALSAEVDYALVGRQMHWLGQCR